MITEFKLESGKNEFTQEVLGFKTIAILDNAHSFEIGNQAIEPNKPYDFGLPLVITLLDKGIKNLMVSVELLMKNLYPVKIKLELYGGLESKFVINKTQGVFWYGQETVIGTIVDKKETVLGDNVSESQLLVDALSAILKNAVPDPVKRRKYVEQIDNVILVHDARSIKVTQLPDEEIEYSILR